MFFIYSNRNRVSLMIFFFLFFILKTNRRVFTLFQFQDSKMEQLIDHLNSYSKHGIPQLHSVDEDLEEGQSGNESIKVVAYTVVCFSGVALGGKYFKRLYTTYFLNEVIFF